ncbi:MAG: DUF4129 domain-containing protein [Chloroflexota bacterium]|nr:DUF4129 domain-containing protein [Chloroflexota bacterium]
MRNRTDGAATTQAALMSRRTPRWRSPERLSDVAFIGLLTLLEVLPIQAAALVMAGSTGFLDQQFGPFWLIVATLLAFALARWRIGGSHPVWVTSTYLPIGALAIVCFIRLSPTAYGSAPGGILSTAWLDQLGVDAAYSTQRFNGLFAIIPLVIYLGWRGIALGGPLPRIETALRRYMLSLAVVILACIGGLSAPQATQTPLQSALLLVVALDVFAGLAAAALARRGGGREWAEQGSGAETARWLLTALGAAAVVVGAAFALGLAVNLRLARPLIAALGVIGGWLNVGITWLTGAIAYVLWVLFANTLGAWLFHNEAFYVTPPRSLSGPVQRPHKSVLVPPPHWLVMAAEVVAIALVVALVLGALFLAVRLALRVVRPPEDPELDEEREALDAGGLLRRQIADMLGGWRRRPASEPDPLAPGGVRWLYRETLRAGAAVGLARRPGETADEYSKRLAVIAHEQGEDGLGLTALTRAYDDARYGERDAAAGPDAVAEAQSAASALARLRGSR